MPIHRLAHWRRCPSDWVLHIHHLEYYCCPFLKEGRLHVHAQKFWHVLWHNFKRIKSDRQHRLVPTISTLGHVIILSQLQSSSICSHDQGEPPRNRYYRTHMGSWSIFHFCLCFHRWQNLKYMIPSVLHTLQLKDQECQICWIEPHFRDCHQ